ncbi:MAG: POTRA domain-containing protein, partial [Bacteroidota bacterium]
MNSAPCGRRAKRYVFFAIPLLLLLASCHTTGHLNLSEDQYLIRKNVVRYSNKEQVENANEMYYELESQIRPQANGSFMVFAEERVYNWKNQWWKNRGRPAAIYTEEAAEASERNLEDYLFDRGYFDATAEHRLKPRRWPNRKKAEVIFTINTEARYHIDSISYRAVDTSDQRVQRLLNDLKEESLLSKGAPLDNLLFEQEKNRIASVLRNSGYAYFSRNYIPSLKVDTTNNSIEVLLEVLPPSEGQQHEIFTIGTVTVNDNITQGIPPERVRDTLIDGIHFRYAADEITVRPQRITENIFLRSGELFKLANQERTLVRLRGLQLFRFVNLRQEVDAEVPTQINIFIDLTMGKLMSFGGDFELNLSIPTDASVSNVLGPVVGTATSLNFQKRNVGRRGQILNLGLESGIELSIQNLGLSNVYIR